MTNSRIRLPSGLRPCATAAADCDAEALLLADRDTLREIVAGLDRLEALVDTTPVLAAAKERGYFTPDEDDRVRQALLAYRNYRLGAYEIIYRYVNFAQITDENLRLRCFLVAFAAALVLYAKSLKIIQVAEHEPLLRAKLNEPDSKFDLQAGFFNEVIICYSSIVNCRVVAGADRHWRNQRGSPIVRSLNADPDWKWLCDIVRHKRLVVRRRLFDVLRRRIRYDWRAFWRTAFKPARRTRYGLQTLVGGRFAGAYIVSHPVHVLTSEVLGLLRPLLQPGDVLLCRAEGKLTAALVPGFWSHAAIYLGSRPELESAEVHDQPHAAKRWDQIPENSGPLGCVIEGVAPRVRICSLEVSLCGDHVVVLRPNLPKAEIAAAVGEAFGHLGKPYDFEFNFGSSSRIVCTELVYRCYQRRGAIQFPLVKRLGRFTLTGDDIVDITLNELEKTGGAKSAPMRPVALILKRRDGRAHAVTEQRIVPVLRRIRRGWRPARKSQIQSNPVAS